MATEEQLFDFMNKLVDKVGSLADAVERNNDLLEALRRQNNVIMSAFAKSRPGDERSDIRELDRIIDGAMATGEIPTNGEIARKLGLSERTFYRQKKSDSLFARRLSELEEFANSRRVMDRKDFVDADELADVAD